MSNLADDPVIDPALRTKWLEALRSGKYKQARATLRDETGAMCCMGVLCDIADPTKWVSDDSVIWEYEGSTAYPPRELLALVGIVSQGSLANRNDGRGHSPQTLEQIADYIESGGGQKYERG